MIPARQIPQPLVPPRVAGRCDLAGERLRPPAFILHFFRPLGSRRRGLHTPQGGISCSCGAIHFLLRFAASSLRSATAALGRGAVLPHSRGTKPNDLRWGTDATSPLLAAHGLLYGQTGRKSDEASCREKKCFFFVSPYQRLTGEKASSKSKFGHRLLHKERGSVYNADKILLCKARIIGQLFWYRKISIGAEEDRGWRKCSENFILQHCADEIL